MRIELNIMVVVWVDQSVLLHRLHRAVHLRQKCYQLLLLQHLCSKLEDLTL